MDEMAIAGMIFTLLMVLIIGGMVMLLPLTRRLAPLIEAKIREKSMQTAAPDYAPLLEAIHSLESEVRRLNERQEFTEDLLASVKRASAIEAPKPDPRNG